MLTREQRWEQKRVAFLSSRGTGFGSQPPPQLPESSEAFAVSYDAAASALREDLRGAAAQQSMLSQNAAALAAGPRRAAAASSSMAPPAYATARAPGADAVDAAAASAGYGRGYGTAPLAQQPQAPYGAPAAASAGYGATMGASYVPQAGPPLYAASPGLPPPSSRIQSREEAWAAKARAHAGEQHPRMPAEQQYGAPPPHVQQWQQAPPQYAAAPFADSGASQSRAQVPLQYASQQQYAAAPFADSGALQSRAQAPLQYASQQQYAAAPFADSGASQSRASSRGSASSSGLGGIGASLLSGGLPPRPTASGASAYAGAVSIGGPMAYGGGGQQRAGMAMENTGTRRQPPGGGSTLRFG